MWLLKVRIGCRRNVPRGYKAIERTCAKSSISNAWCRCPGGPIEAVAAGAGEDKLGAYVASSRSVLYGFNPEEADSIDWRNTVSQCAKKEASELNNTVKDVLERKMPESKFAQTKGILFAADLDDVGGLYACPG